MAKKKKIIVKAAASAERPEREPKPIGDLPVTAGTTTDEVQENFIVSSYTLNKIETEDGDKLPFPGNINPEGYFYSPFQQVQLKELDDNLQTLSTRRVNFVPSADTTNVIMSSVTFYRTESGYFEDKIISVITIKSPISYPFIIGQPFCIYDVMEDVTYRGHLDAFETTKDAAPLLTITTEAEISYNGLSGLEDEDNTRKSRYIISFLEDNAPEYAEYIPSIGKLVWRGPKKMSDLTADSPIYNMPFTNGRLYIHKNIDLFVRRQDSHNEFKLLHPSLDNPLRRFQIEGNPRIDFDAIKIIIDSMVDAC